MKQQVEKEVGGMKARKKDEEYQGLGKTLTRWMVGRYFPGYSIYKTRPPTKGRVLKPRTKLTLQEAQDLKNYQARLLLDQTEMELRPRVEVASPEIIAAVDAIDNPGINYEADKAAYPAEGSINPYVGLKGE
jgi:hypothetical protein